MAQRELLLYADVGVFRGLAKGNMTFHQCVAELIDNSIAATPVDSKFAIEILLSRIDEDQILLHVIDQGAGMSPDELSSALQLGRPPDSNSRLNEHGFGLKNALAHLTGGDGAWDIFSKKRRGSTVSQVTGPFGRTMVLNDDSTMPDDHFIPADAATVIRVPTSIKFLQSVQYRGARTTDLALLRERLSEHLGVLYRGFLTDDAGDARGTISISVDADRLRVRPIPVPYATSKRVVIPVELAGQVYSLEYVYGEVDDELRGRFFNGSGLKNYYLGTNATSGIDIRLGRRVIATHQLEGIWTTDDGEPIKRANDLNQFVGELIVPETIPRGVLSTVNNKIDVNRADPDWRKVFDKLNEHKPPRSAREHTESDLRDKWIRMLKATNPTDQVTDERHVWPTGTRIDVYRKPPGKNPTIYEIKVGEATPQHLYQLRMYWDGLCVPKPDSAEDFAVEAILIVSNFSNRIEEMANLMNSLPPPDGSPPYNFKLQKLVDLGLKGDD